MEYLIELIEKRKEVGRRPIEGTGSQNMNNSIEHHRLGELIIKEVNRLYDEGKLKS